MLQSRSCHSLAVAVLAAGALCGLAQADIVYPLGTPLASGNVTIPESPGAPESVTLSTPVALSAGQLYWVAVLPASGSSGAFWAQNPALGQPVAFSGDGTNWSDSGFGAAASPGQFDVKNGSGGLIYSNMAADPLNTGNYWGIAGASANPACTPYCYNAYASYFFSPVTATAASIDVPLLQNSFTGDNGQQITYDPYATVELFAANPQYIVNPTDSNYTLDQSSGTLTSAVNGYQNSSGGTSGPYAYTYSVSYTGDGNVLAIPLVNAGDIFNLSYDNGVALGGLNQLPETIEDLFGSKFHTAIVLDLPNAPSGNTVSFRFDSNYAPSEVQWDVLDSSLTDSMLIDPPAPDPTPEPGTLWMGAAIVAAFGARRRRGRA